MKRLFRHIRRWNKWRKCSMNDKIDKLLVLFNFISSPTFEVTYLENEYSNETRKIELYK